MYKIISTCKGGGYMYCRTIPVHPKSNSKGLYPLHRVLAENKIGRSLLQGEDVHHIDKNKMNNSPDNLEVLTKSDHTKKHKKNIDNLLLNCPFCKTDFYLKPRIYRLRIGRNVTKNVYCSISCATKYNN